jgi:hypothetical protein
MHKTLFAVALILVLTGIAAAEPRNSRVAPKLIGPPQPPHLTPPARRLDLQLKPTSPLFRPSGPPEFVRPSAPDLKKPPVRLNPDIQDKLKRLDRAVAPVKPFSAERTPGGGILKYGRKW